MDGLLIWYAVCLVGLLVAIHEPAQQKPERNPGREWLAQVLASCDPLPDYLYDPEQSKPMELTNHGRAEHQKR